MPVQQFGGKPWSRMVSCVATQKKKNANDYQSFVFIISNFCQCFRGPERQPGLANEFCSHEYSM